MGFESFQVELKGDANTFASKGAFGDRFPQAKPDPDAIPLAGSAFFIVDDGLHIVEIEVSDSTARMSIRFTLCHPGSIIQAFLNLLQDLIATFDMSARIRDDVRVEHSGWYSAARIEEFSSIVSGYVANRRSEWIANFGPEEVAANTSEVFRRIVLPSCLPKIKSMAGTTPDVGTKANRLATVEPT